MNILEAAYIMQEECKKYSNCDDCPMDYGCCDICEVSPCNWEITIEEVEESKKVVEEG